MPDRHDASCTSQAPGGRLSRRTLLRQMGTTGAAATLAAGSAVVGFDDSLAMAQGAWNDSVDLVIVGSGAAGLTAAVVAADLGSSVIVLEKASAAGGTTAKSDRGYWIPANPYQQALGLDDSPAAALEYMARVAYPQLYDPSDPQLGLPGHEFSMLSAFAANAAPAIETLDRLGAVSSAVAVDWTDTPYPDHAAHLQGENPTLGRSLHTVDAQGDRANGAEMVRQLRAAAEQRGVTILTGYRAARLVLNDRRQVIGLEATPAGADPAGTPEAVASPAAGEAGAIAIGASKAVLFASGGFTHDPALVLSFQHGPLFGGYAVPTNQGDVIRIAGAIGAKLGNMQSAFRAQVILDQALASRSVPTDVFAIPGDGFIMVDKEGRRVVNEKSSYDSRSEVHTIWDGSRSEWKNLILFLLYDQRQADRFAGIHPFPAAGADAPYVLSGETWQSLREQIAERLAEIGDRTGGFSLDDAFDPNLQETIARFNQFAETGDDLDFHRGDAPYDVTWATAPPPAERLSEGESWPDPDQPNITLRALSDTGPYYAILLGAGTLDTNGGPVINDRGQLVDAGHQPIPGLYGAGNCVASPCADAYFGGGTALGSAITFGYLAGQHAHQEPAKSV